MHDLTIGFHYDLTPEFHCDLTRALKSALAIILRRCDHFWIQNADLTEITIGGGAGGGIMHKRRWRENAVLLVGLDTSLQG